MLRSFVDDNPEDWDLYSTNVEFAINDSRSDFTGFTPFELCYGVSPMSQLDMFLEAAQPASGRRKGGVGTAHEWASRFSSSPMLGTPWEEVPDDNSTECLPWERREVTSKGETT
ncbi:hypothetical protein CYMTET_46526 [Cymbomonas tetramitiformis]|uniref:Uncharacterized protein n=1 Tax=Cymbomonas tetramitiformis TaxID=36881 RepID=A0AAE0BXC1_9CHLO|nr:hypothetical protein CYMTET_46526 [Cymbomonas tetramitiformis]